MQRFNKARVLLLVVIAAVAGTSCSRSPEAQKARHLERGEKFFARKDYKDAIIEYRNVLRIEPTNAVAIRRLGLAHYQTGQFRDAFPYLRKATELTPQDEDVRLKLGTILLVAQRPDDARAQATAVLDRDAKNFEGLILLVDSARKPAEIDAALKRLEDERITFQDRPKYHIALGRLYLKKRDMPKAEQAFKDAIARNPKAVEAHTALGEFYVVARDLDKAEQELKAAADLSPKASQARMHLADFYVRTGKREAAKQLLTEVTRSDADYLPAWRRLVDISLTEQRYDEALQHLGPVFKKNPADLEGQLLRGRAHLAKRQTTEAVNDFQAVVKLEPKLARAHYFLGLAQLEAGNVQQAKAALKEAITIEPSFADARLTLARLNIQTGGVQPAIEDLQDLVQSTPNLVPAHMLLGAAHMRNRDGVKAAEVFKKVVSLDPKDPQGPYHLGLALAMQGKRAEASKQFESALAIAPGYADPLAQLVRYRLADKDAAGAAELVKKQVAAAPKSGPLHELLGRVYLVQGKKADAEKALLTAIDLEPRLVSAYGNLAALYASEKNYDQAIAKLEKAHQLAPKNVAPLMVLGTIHEQRGDIPKAQQTYEQVLTLNPRFAAAANNLAYLYIEHGGDKERALQLAQTAKQIAPDDPSISDTLGWVLYHRGIYQRALALLEESAAKAPDNPSIQYHLGVVYAKLGNKDGARKAFAAAVGSKRQFPEMASAKRALAELN
jgi:tetratricopeptide (TPR) repeat protein